jgi:hypothetical protein
VFLSLLQLKRTDLALQAGERFLQQFPGSTYASSIDLQLRSMIEAAHRHEDAVKQGVRDLEQLDFDEREAVRQAKERGRELDPVRARNFDFQRCSLVVRAERWAEGLEACKGFADAYKSGNDDDNIVKLARYLMIRCWTELGRFDEANDEALRLLDEFPSWAHSMSLEVQRKTWPQP